MPSFLLEAFVQGKVMSDRVLPALGFTIEEPGKVARESFSNN